MAKTLTMCKKELLFISVMVFGQATHHRINCLIIELSRLLGECLRITGNLQACLQNSFQLVHPYCLLSFLTNLLVSSINQFPQSQSHLRACVSYFELLVAQLHLIQLSSLQLLNSQQLNQEWSVHWMKYSLGY